MLPTPSGWDFPEISNKARLKVLCFNRSAFDKFFVSLCQGGLFFFASLEFTFFASE